MTGKKWILVGCVALTAAIVCAVTFAEKNDEKGTLPAAVEAAVKAAFPNAAIEKFQKEGMEIEVFEVELKDAAMNVAPDGTVVAIETVEQESALPPAVAATLKAQNAKVIKVEKEIKKAELKLVKLDTPVTTYEAKINKDGKEIEIQIRGDGKIMAQKAVDKEEKDKDKD